MNAQDIKDKKHIAAVIAGDTNAFAHIIADYEAKLGRYVTYLTHNSTLADDILQDTFIRAYQNLNGFNPKYKFSSWLYRIAHNTAMNALRHENKFDWNADAVEIAEKQATEPTVIRDIDRAIMAGDVTACLNGLEPKYRETLMLRYYENMSYDEIADILHIPPATAGVWIARGKQKLKQLCQQKGVKR